MEEYISYYELLTMIKNCEQIREYPKVYWHNNYRDKVLYIPTFDSVSGDLEGYHLKNRNLENEDIRYWLSECMLESSMFDKCLEIKEDKKEKKKKPKIEKLDLKEIRSYYSKGICLGIASKVNQIIDKMEEK